MLLISGSAPLLMQKDEPTRDAADKFYESYVARVTKTLDANDLLYQVSASRNYDPSAQLEKITVPVMWVNSADDFINPAELGITQRARVRIKHGHFILIAASEQTHGHGTHTWAAIWQQYLQELLEESKH
jgi:homoserine O-acetyltransferase